MDSADRIVRIPILVICFSNEIPFGKIPLFRGAILSKIPSELTLFHNHVGEGFRYKYPLIQYKRIAGKAAIVCLGEGTDAIGEFFAQADMELRIGNDVEHYNVDKVLPSNALIQPWQGMFHYTCRKWLPLNQQNYQAYIQIEGVAERALFLQKILVGNILSMCTGLQIHIEKDIICEITALSEMSVYKYKGVIMSGFDIEFKTNISLPDYIGLGKGASLGFGMIKQVKYKQNNQ